MCFLNYQNKILLEFRVSTKDEYFIDIITNSNQKKFALVNNSYQLKIFESSKKNVKIIFEDLDL